MKRSSFKMIFFALKISRGGVCCIPAALLLSSAEFSQINVFKNFFQDYHQNFKHFGTGSKLFVKVISRRQKPPLAGKDLNI